MSETDAGEARGQLDIFGYIDAGGLVVTANARAARALALRYATGQRTAGREVWPTPHIYEWRSWLGMLWRAQETSSRPVILASLQESSIWKKVTHAAGAAHQVVSLDSLAGLAQQSYALLDAYLAHEGRNHSWGTTENGEPADAEQFRSWAAAFEAECRRLRVAPASRLESLVAEATTEGSVAVPAEVWLLGFDRMTPAQEAVASALRMAGCQLRELVTPELEKESHRERSRLPDEVQLVEAADLRDEIASCAWWIRRQLERDGARRLAVVAPQIDALRGELERVFRGTLAPESQTILSVADSLPFEFSLGQPLAEVPLARAALLLLRWLAEPLSLQEVSWLALSGFLATSESELLETAKLDAALSDCGFLPPQIAIEAYAERRLARSGAARAWTGRLRDSLRTLREAEGRRKRQEHAAWAWHVEELLAKAGWPGYQRLASADYQARQRWTRVLDEVAALDFSGETVTYAGFVKALERQARETIFAAESRNAPVQIVGALESSGQSWDAVWMLGADDESWPRAGRPAPLLPLWLQRKYAMPHAKPQVDWELAERATRRIGAAAPAVVFSYAAQAKNGPTRQSPLLKAAMGSTLARKTPELRAELDVVERAPDRRLEEVAESALIPWPAERAAGGSEVLKRQAACAFQSFAAKRLAAQELASGERGLNPAERGQILHQVLDSLWSEKTDPVWRLRTRDDLANALAAGRLQQLIAHHVDTALSGYREQGNGDGWMRAYLEGERARLTHLLNAWLQEEVKRRPFEVEATEHTLENVTVGDLKLKLRADRIDRLPSGGHVLVDYKTGEVKASSWRGDRPEEPQLPLYAAFGGIEKVEGVLFAQVRPNALEFKGHIVDARATLNPSLTGTSALVKSPLSDEMLEEWSAALMRLAEAFLRGEAAVEPKKYPETCRYCALSGLCRVRETAAARRAMPELDDEDSPDA